MHKLFLKTAALLGAFTVILGAFAAHSIKNHVTPDTLAVFETAVRYQMYHVIALLFTAILYKEFTNKTIIWAGNFFIAGIILFCSSLYLLTYFKAVDAKNMFWLGAVTPFGGVCFIVGWCLLFKGFLPKK